MNNWHTLPLRITKLITAAAALAVAIFAREQSKLASVATNLKE